MPQSHVEVPVAETVHEHHDRGRRVRQPKRFLQTFRVRMNVRWHGAANGVGNRRKYRRQVQRSPTDPFRWHAISVACRFGHGKQLFVAWHFNTHDSYSSTAVVPAGNIARLITITFP